MDNAPTPSRRAPRQDNAALSARLDELKDLLMLLNHAQPNRQRAVED